MKWLGFFFILMQVSLQSAAAEIPAGLKKLIEGNQRFATENSSYPDRTAERRQEMIATQEPFAVIVGCSDSRVAPEILFDQGLGDLFIVRVAGNVVGPVERDSIEYSVIYLHSSTILVLGHENCAAVQAVMQGKTKDIEAVATLIQPAVDKVKKGDSGNLEAAVKANVAFIVEDLKKKEPLKSLVEKKKLTIAGGYYNFHTGKVELLP